jgi:CubicO group peptidase (beta-lactamase class C family)
VTFDTGPLRAAAQREIDDGLTACQLAVAYDGDVVWTESFGTADDATRFMVASATKPIVASTAWQFLGDGGLELDRPVADYVPEFATNGKASVTVEQVFLMTAGFPTAPMQPLEGADPERRRARFATWELEYEPGTKYVYHGASAHWVLADLIERCDGDGYCDVVEQRVTQPLGLPRLLGIPRAEQHGIAQLALPVSNDLPWDRADTIEAGVPGGGGVMTAPTLARFYQGLLHNPGRVWDPEVLADGTGHVRCTLPDPMMGMPANRTLGVVVGNGFGGVWGSSPTAYGWPGAGGQVGFAEPATGVSFAFLQAGDPDPQHAFVRAIVLSDLALALRP